MGKAGRFACIIIPFLLTLASFICLILTFAAGQDKGKPTTLSNLYFMKADLTNFTTNTDLIKGTDIDNDLLSALTTASKQGKVAEIYQIYIWDYCSGNKTGGSSTNSSSGTVDLDYCSSRKSSFWFNPEEVWGLNSTTASQLFGKELNSGLKAYHKVSGWMFAAYAVAFFATLAELVVGGVFSICSRWGSCVTSLVASVATLFTIAAAITSTALYATLAGVFDSVFKDYGIKASLGHQSLVVTWLGVVFSIAAGLFWTLSSCCCSGKSSRKTVVEKTPYTYERVESPYLGHSANQGAGAVPMQGVNHHRGHSQAYEPFRHDSRV